MPVSLAESSGGGRDPFSVEWSERFGVPPFGSIRPEHYRAAFESGIAELQASISAILENPQPADFENTIRALELASPGLDRMLGVFRNMTSTDTNETLQSLQRELLPSLSEELDAIAMNAALFERVEAVSSTKDGGILDLQDARLVELTLRGFLRSGAALPRDSQDRLRQVNAALVERTTSFAQNLLVETKSFELWVEDQRRLAGLPADFVAAAGRAAGVKGQPGSWVFGLERSAFESFMTHAEDRQLRRELFEAYCCRGARGGESDNTEVLRDIISLRAERANLLGYEDFATFQLATTMAKKPARVMDLLLDIWEKSLEKVETERADLQELAARDELEDGIQAWDWWFYSERLRLRRFALDDERLRPYFELGRVRNGAFHVANRLFGLSFTPIRGLELWHPTVEAFEVQSRKGRHLGVIFFDFFARESKKSGAWMNTFRDGSSAGGRSVRPLVVNCLNLTLPPTEAPAFLRFEEVETLFHEFGHALHGLMTRARYERFSGTSGSPRDYVEFPSQLMEHFAAEPEVLAVYARHWETEEPLPSGLVEKLRRGRTHNQGFKTVEYLAAALLDMAWHSLSQGEARQIEDVVAFEAETLESYGLPREIEPRYRSPYFAHIFSSPGGYAAGYYAYLWSAILDADGFEAFKEAGDVFDPSLARRLQEHVYEAGYAAPGAELYRRFRGRDPETAPLLRNRGLL